MGNYVYTCLQQFMSFSLLLILLDIDECAIGTDMCDTNANCTNTDGSYNCTCDNGYSGDGFTCSESTSNECDTHVL